MQQQIVKGRELYTRSWRHEFDERAHPSCGYAFSCDAAGQLDADSTPELLENYRYVLAHPELYRDRGVQQYDWRWGRLCDCDSGQSARKLFDAQGIYLCSVCDSCEASVRSGYNPWVFEGYGQGTLDEPLDEEE